VNGGGSVALTAMALALTLGCNHLYIYGFDCHTSEKHYADGIVGVGVERNEYEIEVEGEVFTTNSSYLSFAQQFFLLVENAKKQGLIKSVKVKGKSLVNAMANTDLTKISDENVDGKVCQATLHLVLPLHPH